MSDTGDSHTALTFHPLDPQEVITASQWVSEFRENWKAKLHHEEYERLGWIEQIVRDAEQNAVRSITP